jgi:hypothetical protein
MKTYDVLWSFEENNIAYLEVGSSHRSVINISSNNSGFILEEQWFAIKSKLRNK